MVARFTLKRKILAMKKSFAVFFSAFVLLFSTMLIISCNNDDAGPSDVQSPLVAEPSTLTVSTGTTGLVAVSGGVTPYTILNAPDASIATATAATIGVVTVTPVSAGATTITVQDNSSPVKTIDIPITVIIGHGTVAVAWTVNGQEPYAMCGQVNSNQVRVTIAGYSPVLNPCGLANFNIDSITAGDHSITAELLSPSSVVLATITQNVYVAADESTPLTLNFTAPLIIGSFHPTWTINSQPSGTGCQNATSVRISLGNLFSRIEPCSNGQLTITTIPAGTYLMVADLLDASNTILSHLAQNVTIQISQTTPLALNFTTGAIAGSATINWTVNGGQNCVTNGNVSITATGPSNGNFNSACGAYGYDIQNLGPGTYTFDLVLTDPSHVGQQATAQIQNVTISDHQHSTFSADLNCLFCGGTSSAGFVKVNVSCGGAACGLTGTLYVIVKDCGSSNTLNNENEPGSTLTGGSPISHTVSNVLSGARCVLVYLDVDSNGIISAGDAVSVIAEQNIFVYGGQTTNVDVTLDSVSPKVEPTGINK